MEEVYDEGSKRGLGEGKVLEKRKGG